MRQGRVWKYGDDVNTDVIFPGKYTYTLRTPEEIAPHALEDLDPAFVCGVEPGDIIVAGNNWGCGSSREQAATCLVYNGVSAVVAKSFGRIFYRNAINNGLAAVACSEAVEAIQAGETISVDLDACVVRCDRGQFPFPPVGESLVRILEAGGLVAWAKERLAS
ncbi:MAG: 3-isopropylmalate dehydratase [Acidobacteriota bacterium]|nr:3-isopropylmalate dehydratase [Acidobacteriota bacterium]